jgi:serine/threonine protein kinase
MREFTLQGQERGRKVQVCAELKGGRYEVMDVLADGGMGVVFRARDRRVGGNVVLVKGVKYDPACFGFDRRAALYHLYTMRQQFRREKNVLLEMGLRGVAQLPALLDFFEEPSEALMGAHPFGRFEAQERLLVGGQEVVVEPGREPWMVMERIFGQSLRQAVPLLSEARLLEVARGVCRILERVHRPRVREDGRALSFLYMDLKPDNLLLDKQGGVRLVDFGAAVPVVDGRRLGQGAYTPGYAAPELRRASHPGVALDGRVDVYSLGAILFFGCSERWTDPASLAGEDDFPVLDLGLLRREVRPATREVIAKALARDPAERFGSVVELREGVERALRA